MKELHNHIFSNTTCISKETMLRYINHQLSEKELHEVEKHMLDCELCSDALAGMKYAQNSSMLFAIDNQIDQRVRSGQQRTPMIRNLMVAASLLIIVFGSYFTFNFFNETVDGEANIAMNNEDTKSVQQELQVLEEDAEFSPMAEGEIDKKDNGDLLNSAGNAVIDNLENEVLAVEQPEIIEEVAEAELDNDMFEAAIVVEDEEEERDYRYKNEEESLKKEAEKSVVQAESRVESTNNRSESLGLGWSSNKQANNSPQEAVRKKSEKKQKGKAKKDAPKKFKMSAANEAPSFDDQDLSLTDNTTTKNPSKVVVIKDHKVVDYTDEYQKAFDANQEVMTKSVSADFATEKDKELAEREQDELRVEVTYKATLTKAMAYYKAKKYTLALEEFNIILKEHPEEVNGLFYGGMSYYNLKRYNDANKSFEKVLTNDEIEFNQEARWYKALTLIELKQIESAKKLLSQIVENKEFYKTKAEAKLKELK